MTAQQRQMQALQNNMDARNLIVAKAVKMTQNIFSTTFNPQSLLQFNVPFRNVGLVLGFWVDLAVSAADPTSTNVYTLTALGPANLVKQFIVTDLNNNTRIQTTGWHVHFVNTAKKGAPFCVARTNTSYPIAYRVN